MVAKVVGIGNSAGIVIPAALMNSLGLKKNDRVSIAETADGFLVTKTAEEPKTFEALLENFYGKPFAEASELFQSEEDDAVIDWGEPRGEERMI